MALVCQKVVSQSRNTLRNGALAAKLGIFTLWSFAAVSQLQNTLRNGALPAKMGSFMLWWFAAVSQLQNEGHCAAKWHSCAKKWLHSCENFRREGLVAANWFRSKVLISQRLRNLADPCFCPVFALFSLRLTSKDFLSISLHFLLILIIQKPILHQNNQN